MGRHDVTCVKRQCLLPTVLFLCLSLAGRIKPDLRSKSERNAKSNLSLIINIFHRGDQREEQGRVSGPLGFTVGTVFTTVKEKVLGFRDKFVLSAGEICKGLAILIWIPGD